MEQTPHWLGAEAMQTKRAAACGRPPAHEIEERRNHLIEVATRLFLTRGYEATSLEHIAKAAGASKTTIYRNFGDKADLFRAILNRFVEPIWPKFGDIPTEGKSPEDVLTTFGELLISSDVLSADSMALLRLIFREAVRFPELSQIFGETETTTTTAMARYLADAVERKLLSLDDPTWAATQFIELIWGTLSRRLLVGTTTLPDAAERRRVIDASVKLFLSGALPRG